MPATARTPANLRTMLPRQQQLGCNGRRAVPMVATRSARRGRQAAAPPGPSTSTLTHQQPHLPGLDVQREDAVRAAADEVHGRLVDAAVCVTHKQLHVGRRAHTHALSLRAAFSIRAWAWQKVAVHRSKKDPLSSNPSAPNHPICLARSFTICLLLVIHNLSGLPCQPEHTPCAQPLKLIGYFLSYLACRIGQWVPIGSHARDTYASDGGRCTCEATASRHQVELTYQVERLLLVPAAVERQVPAVQPPILVLHYTHALHESGHCRQHVQMSPPFARRNVRGKHPAGDVGGGKSMVRSVPVLLRRPKTQKQEHRRRVCGFCKKAREQGWQEPGYMELVPRSAACEATLPRHSGTPPVTRNAHYRNEDTINGYQIVTKSLFATNNLIASPSTTSAWVGCCEVPGIGFGCSV
jgi:hypothetical protein